MCHIWFYKVLRTLGLAANFSVLSTVIKRESWLFPCFRWQCILKFELFPNNWPHTHFILIRVSACSAWCRRRFDTELNDFLHFSHYLRIINLNIHYLLEFYSTNKFLNNNSKLTSMIETSDLNPCGKYHMHI